MATKTKTRRWIPCQSYDLEAMESWLEEMARCGWRLEQVAPLPLPRPRPRRSATD